MLGEISSKSSEIYLPPTYWKILSEAEKEEFLRLKASFDQGQKIATKDRRIISFNKELLLVRDFVERSEENYEARCVLAGIAFTGPLICINTRQLKHFLSRCKSSINGSFQQLGYVTLRTKSKARKCVLTVLPSLIDQQNILRQWTVRVVSDSASFCFVSSFPLPNFDCRITDEDFYDEKRSSSTVNKHSNHLVSPIPKPPKNKPKNSENVSSVFSNFSGISRTKPSAPGLMQFDLSSISDFEPNDDPTISYVPISFSMNSFHDDMIWDDSPILEGLTIANTLSVKRSISANFNTANEWDLLDGL